MVAYRAGTGCGDNYWVGFSDSPDKEMYEILIGKVVGPTAKDCFLARIRFGSYWPKDSPNRVHVVVMSDYQVNAACGKAWMKILHDEGFEFIRTVDNATYSRGRNGPAYGANADASLDLDTMNDYPHKIHVFMLMRNIGASRVKNPYEPPEGWPTEGGVQTAWGNLDEKGQLALADAQSSRWRAIWESRRTEFLSADHEGYKKHLEKRQRSLAWSGYSKPPAYLPDCDCEICAKERARHNSAEAAGICASCQTKLTTGDKIKKAVKGAMGAFERVG